MFSKHYIINFIINQNQIVMKKLSLFLSALFISVMSFAAALGEGYSKVTDITTLSAGDKVVLYCDDAELGVTGWNGSKDATVAAEGWVEYVVEAAEGGVLLKDGEQYVGLTGKNRFDYTATGSVCKVNAEGVLYITLDGADYLLYENGGQYYRMYVDKSGNDAYKPFYVYKVAAVEEPAEKPVVTAAELEQINGEEEIFHFYLSQGVAVDKNPESPYYGYTYVTAATDGASDGGSDRADTQKRGIFVFDAELNSLNPDNVGFLPANAAPLMTDVSRQALHRLAVNPVNNHVVFCYNVEGASAIWSMDPANLAGDAVNLIEGLAITKANAFCFDAEGTLYVMDNANTSDGGKIVKVVNGELVTIAQNAIWGVQDISLASDGRGGLWIAQNRWNIDTYAVLSHVNAAGAVDFAVTKDSPEEVKALFPQDANASYRGQCAYNVEKDVLAFGGNKVVALFHVTYDDAGVPSIAKIGATPVVGSNIDGVDFYANGDLAVVSASAERFQKYAVTYTVEAEIEWIEMPLEISNLTTMEMPVEGVTYLQLTGRDDMNDADVMLFLNNYTGEEKAYEVNAESSFMTFGGMELTVMDGSITKSVDPELGDVYAGIVHASVEEDGVAMYVAFDLKMYALPAIEIAIEDVEITVNEESAIATFAATWEGSPLSVEVSGFEEVEFKEYPECWLSIGDDNVWVDAAAGPAAIIIEDGVAMLEGEFTSFATGKSYYVMLSGKLPVKEEPVVEPVYEENKLNPFAFGLESVLSEDASLLTVTYRLNNSNATSVDVVVYNGEEVVATVPGTTTIGVNVVEVATADLPAGVQLTWGVVVKGTSVEAPTQEEKMYSMYCPHGLAIDKDPESEYFGRILVADAMNVVKDKTGYLGSGIGAGLHVFNPSFTTDSTVYTGGNDFTRILDSNGYQPWRVKISEDGRIFVSSLDLNGVAVWEVSKDLQTWTPVIAGTNDATDYNIYDADSNFVAGLNCSMDVVGSGENLKLLLYSTNNKGIAFNQSGYRLDEYALGTATTWTGTPKNILEGGKLGLVHTNVEFIYDGEGGYWFGASRAGNAGQPNLVHINAAGEQDYYTEDAGLYGGDGVLVHNGMLFKGKARTSSTVGNFGVWTIGKDADGKVTLTEKWTVAANGIGRNLNEFAVDYAENLYVVGNSGEKIIAYALPYSGEVTTPAASQYGFKLASKPTVVTEMVGVVKRALQDGENTIVLTHEADGTAHIYSVVDGTITELVQDGVIARDPENAGDLLAISDIALTEDGKLVATNYMQTQSGDDYVDAGYKRGETRIYIWNDLHGAPSILFTSKMSSNWFRSKQGLTMAVKGTSDNMEIFMTGIHATKAWARVSSYRVINGVYEEPAVNNNDYYHFYDVADAVALETTVGTQYELTASPLGAMNWILDAELINPVEIVEPETNNVEISSCVALSTDLGKKFNGTSIVTVGEQVLMVAPYATAEGLLAGVKVLDITAGLAAATEVKALDLDAPVEATAAATAVKVVDGELVVTLVADATIYTLGGKQDIEYMVIEDNITNLTIDLENMAIIGGPSTMWQVEVFLGLAEDDNMDGQWSLSPESSVAIMGFDARFIDGYVYDIDVNAPAAKAVLYVEDSGFFYEIKLDMTNTPTEAIVVVVEDATVTIDTIPLFGDQVDYALNMTADWTYAEDGVTYPVLVEVPVYYPEATEPSEMTCTVTIGGWGENDPWLGFGEGPLTITTVDGVVTAKGIVANPYTGVAFDVTVSGKLPQGPGSGLDNVQVDAKAVKVIKNGMLIINRDGKEYNAQGATLK